MPTSLTNRGRTTNTFVLRLLDSDDKGWVGVVTHVQSGRTTNFKGFIEAVRFMDSFVASESTSEPIDADKLDTDRTPTL